MEAPAPDQDMNSTSVTVSDGSRNCQQQQEQHGQQQQLVRAEPLERQRFQSQPPPIQSEGGIRPIHNNPVPVVGQKRDINGFAVPSDGLPIPNPSPSQDRKSFVKLFVGFVPNNITEDEIRPIFAQHGNVLEVILVKDKITGKQRGFCFIRYATIEEADRAIKALDNNYTLPGSTGPMRVKYADTELERLGAEEYKLFVSNVNTQAKEKEVEEIFARYGRVEYVSIIRDGLTQSKGSAIVTYGSREMATRAIDALNGTFMMEGCQHPLNVKFAESKKRRIGSHTPYPAFGRQGFGYGPMGARSIAGPGRGTRGQCPPTNAHNLGGQIRGSSRWNPFEGTPPMEGAMSGPRGQVHGSAWRPVQMLPQSIGPGWSNSPSLGQAFNSAPMQQQIRLYGQQAPQIQPQLQEQVQQQKQHQMQPQLQEQVQQWKQHQMQPLPYSEMHHNSYNSRQHGQPPQSGPLLLSNEQLPVFQPQLSAPPLQHTANGLHQMQMQAKAPAEHSVNQAIQLPAIHNHFQSQVCPPLQKQQQQPLWQNQQQCSMQLQYPPLQQHPTHTMAHPQQNQIVTTPWDNKQPQAHLDQPKPISMAPTMPPTNTTQPIAAATSVVVDGGPAPTLTCNWTLHTSPEGKTYYYNSVTGESQWEKPAELTSFEQQKEQPPSQVLQPQAQMQQTYSYPQFQFQPQQLQQSQILQPAIATMGQKPAELTMFERQQQQQPSQILQPQPQIQQPPSQIIQPQSQIQQTPSQILQPPSQIQQTDSHPQFQPQQQQQSQILQPQSQTQQAPSQILQPPSQIQQTDSQILQPPSQIHQAPSQILQPQSQIQQTPSQILRPPSQIQQTDSYPQFQPRQQQQSQILQPQSQIQQAPSQILQPQSQTQQAPSQILQHPSQIQQTDSQILQPPSQIQHSDSHPQFQPQQQQQSQILQPQSQIQQTDSHRQFQPQQQQQSQIVEPSVRKQYTIPAIAPAKVAEPTTVTVTTVADGRAPSHRPLTCDWNEHTSPDGLKYYYNKVTGVSQWDKPAELTAFENQQALRAEP